MTSAALSLGQGCAALGMNKASFVGLHSLTSVIGGKPNADSHLLEAVTAGVANGFLGTNELYDTQHAYAAQ